MSGSDIAKQNMNIYNGPILLIWINLNNMDK